MITLYGLCIPPQGFDDQKLGKIYNWKKFDIFVIKNSIYLSRVLHKERPNYRSLQLSKENIQHYMKFLNFFLFLWVIFALLDPDPIDLLQSSGSESETLLHCLFNNGIRQGSASKEKADASCLTKWKTSSSFSAFLESNSKRVCRANELCVVLIWWQTQSTFQICASLRFQSCRNVSMTSIRIQWKNNRHRKCFLPSSPPRCHLG